MCSHLQQGDRIQLATPRGPVLASVQRYREGARTVTVRKLRASGWWGPPVKVRIEDVMT